MCWGRGVQEEHVFIIKERHGNGSVCARARAHSSVTALTSVTAARDVALTTRSSPAFGQDEKIKNTARNRILLLPTRSLSLLPSRFQENDTRV